MDGGVIVFLLFLSPLLTLFIRLLYVEAKETSWGLLEALIAANILGHVVAYPVSYCLNDRYTSVDRRVGEAIFAGLAATMIAAFMAGGAVWVFRRLKMLNESRRAVRIGYMLLGLLLFPSMVAIPFNFLLGWMVWIPLLSLSRQADMAAQRIPARELPGKPQLRYTVAWNSSSGAPATKTNGQRRSDRIV
jgi:putative flippase GtrA